MPGRRAGRLRGRLPAVLQEIFLTAYRKLDTFRGASALGTWLYRLGMNVCLDRLRSKAARQDQATDLLDDRIGHTAHETRMSVNRLDLERAIKALPEGSRAAFLLHDVEGFDHHEVGRILGIAEGTSKSQVHKARLRIREFLRQPAPDPAKHGART
jgi:RNA polymerase sigma-70 factor, ECF subfamily